MPPEKDCSVTVTEEYNPHRIFMIKFLIDCTGMSISDAQQAYEMVKATKNLTGEARSMFKEAIKTYVKGKIFLF